MTIDNLKFSLGGRGGINHAALCSLLLDGVLLDLGHKEGLQEIAW